MRLCKGPLYDVTWNTPSDFIHPGDHYFIGGRLSSAGTCKLLLTIGYLLSPLFPYAILEGSIDVAIQGLQKRNHSTGNEVKLRVFQSKSFFTVVTKVTTGRVTHENTL